MSEPCATIVIDTRRPIGTIDDNAYGHFLESAFFGNIEGGVFDEASPRSLSGPGARTGLRADVIDLCRRLGVPLVRWPGGNFASAYHWEDGIGPRERRPRRLEVAWGSEESNRFGTDEFLAWCSEVGAEPYLAHSCRSVEEAIRWVEYANYAGDTELSRRRAANGHREPYEVRYWGVGNEVYGNWQLGQRPAAAYGADVRQHARFMRRVDPSIKIVAAGSPWDQEQWTRPLLEQAGADLDYVSLHLYGTSTHLFTGDDYDAVVAQPSYFEREIVAYSGLVAGLAAAVGLDQPLGIALDEWNVRHLEPAGWSEPQPGPDGGVAARPEDSLPPLASASAGMGELRVNRYSPRTIADALCYAGMIHALHRACGLEVAPTMANPVNLVNANRIIVARPDGAIPSAVYPVFDLYQNHLGRIAVPVEVESPARTAAVRQGPDLDRHGAFPTVPYLDVSATLTADRRSLGLAVINRHREKAITAELVLDGRTAQVPRSASAWVLSARDDDVHAANSFTDPDRVALLELGPIELTEPRHTFPPRSITLLCFGLV